MRSRSSDNGEISLLDRKRVDLLFHYIYGQLGDGLKAEHAGAQQHIELIATVGFLLLKVIGGAAHGYEGRSLAIEVLGNAANSS